MSLFGAPSTHDDPRATTLRRCAACHQPAVACRHVTFHRVNGVPAGRTYVHRCQGCGREFTTLSLSRALRDGAAAFAMSTIGWLVAPLLTYGVLSEGLAAISGTDVFVLAVLWIVALAGPAIGISVVRSTYHLLANPVVSGPAR